MRVISGQQRGDARSAFALPAARTVLLARSLIALTALITLTALTACGGGGAASPTVVTPPAVASVGLTPSVSTIGVAATQQLAATPLDASSNPLAGRTVTWGSNAPLVAAVSATGLVTGISAGTATITATSEGRNATATVTVVTGPTLLSVTPATLVPGAAATLTGVLFDAIPSNNTVTVQGQPAVVQSATPTQLVVTVPCLATGTAGVRVRVGGVATGLVNMPLQATQRTLAVGQAVVTTDDVSSYCNELVTGGASSRYVVAVFSSATSQNTLTDFDLFGNLAPLAPEPALVRTTATAPVAAPVADAGTLEQRRRDAAHASFLERDRQLYATLRARPLPLAERVARPRAADVVIGDKRSLYFNYASCNDSTQVIRARAVYIGTKTIVWEDSANALVAGTSAALASVYARIGQVFDLDQYNTVKNGFGDPLRRDPITDNDGKVHMIFTQKLNGTSAAAYVTSCDQFPRGFGAQGSNFGEFFYGMVPTTSTPNVNSTASPDGWFAFMERTVVHEVKHIASVASRYANLAPVLEEAWLEEGTARQAEELWSRSALYNAAFRGNTGFGTAASNGIFCDFARADATCAANDALRRPSYGMRRHFNEILPKLQEPWNWSPYGDGTGQSGSVFYQTTWSLVRFAIDRYGASDNAFLTALTQSSAAGTANLAAQAGVPIDRLIGLWGLALYLDDSPGLASPSADISIPTWNLRSIYAGLNAQAAWVSRFPTPFPLTATPLTFGAFSPRLLGLRGGAHAYFEISGVPGATQLLNLRSTTAGAATPTTLRIAIARVQ